jgi:hypothetical protein
VNDPGPILTLRDGRKLQAKPGPCLWCGEWVTIGRTESGATDPLDPAWNIDGDFGCGESPLTDSEGTGDHARAWDLARMILNQEEGGQ